MKLRSEMFRFIKHRYWRVDTQSSSQQVSSMYFFVSCKPNSDGICQLRVSELFRTVLCAHKRGRCGSGCRLSSNTALPPWPSGLCSLHRLQKDGQFAFAFEQSSQHPLRVGQSHRGCCSPASLCSGPLAELGHCRDRSSGQRCPA